MKLSKYNKDNHDFLPVKNYFDYQSSTPTDKRVVEAMLPYFTKIFGNPSSRTHSFGWDAEKAVDDSRKVIAELINGEPGEIIFTSGATESNNLAIKGFAEYNKYKLHIITTQTEHKAVLDTCRYLEDKGVRVTYLPVEADGSIDIDKLKHAIRPETKLISIHAMNNETGVVMDIEKIGTLCKEKGIVFHTDAAQAYGKIPIDVRKCNIGMMSISGHKAYGPKGIGALFIRKSPRVRIKPLFHGGGQERGLRSGTVPTFLTVGLAKASELCKEEMVGEQKKLVEINKLFIDTLKNESCDDFIKNGAENTFPGCLNLSFPYVEGEGLLMKLKDYGLSSGSACTSASLEPSYVLRALGRSDDLAHSSIRFGFGRFTKKKDAIRLAKETAKSVKELREMSPLYEMAKQGIDLSTIKWSA